MRSIFVDSSAWYILADDTNSLYPRARQFYQDNASPLLTSNLVFAETMSLITKRKGKSSAVRAGNQMRLSGRLQIVHVDPLLEGRAWELFAGYSDKGWDLVDCSSFVLMDQMKIEAAFSFNKHFTQRGYKVFPD